MRRTTSYLVTLIIFVFIVLVSFYEVPPTVLERNMIFLTVVSLLGFALYNDGK